MCAARLPAGRDTPTPLKHLLIVYHSQSGKNQAMADAVLRGAGDPQVEGIEVRFLRCFDAGPDDLLWAHAVVLGTPENFGYMSGALKDFLDRTFYPCEGKVEGLPYAVFIGCGNDGRGALSSIRRIAQGFPWREVREPVIVRGELTDDGLRECEELGLAMAAGLEAGIF
jgi:flavorubredoxin